MKHISKALLLWLVILSCTSNSWGALRCQNVLAELDLSSEIQALARLKITLEMAKVKGGNSIATTALKNEYDKKEAELIQVLEQNQTMTRAQLKKHLRQEILNLQKVSISNEQKDQEKEQQKRALETAISHRALDGSRLIFHSVKAAPFKMGGKGGEVNVTLTDDFALAATLTTQVVWRKVVDLINEKFPDTFKLDPDPSFNKGDLLPVESVSYDDIQNWISGLNKLSLAGDPALESIFPTHQKGDLYRLPSEAEWEFTLRCRGQCNERFFFGNDGSILDSFAWYKSNSGSKSQMVGLLTPLVVDNQEFFDMVGNVYQIMQDGFGPLPGGVNPLGAQKKNGKVMRGGCYSNEPRLMESDARNSISTYIKMPEAGFRLARTRP